MAGFFVQLHLADSFLPAAGRGGRRGRRRGGSSSTPHCPVIVGIALAFLVVAGRRWGSAGAETATVVRSTWTLGRLARSCRSSSGSTA